MSVLDITMAAFAVIGCLLWAGVYLKGAQVTGRLTDLNETTPPEPDQWPRLSVVVAARDEADTIVTAMGSLLEEDYPDLEIILINDRSTDGTKECIDELAMRDARVIPLHIDELPNGWLGKVNAIYRGQQKSTGDWILFTDADIHFETGTLRKAIAHVMDREADHLVLMPKIIANSFWLDVVIRGFALLFLVGTRVDQLENPKSNAYVGAGSFNLVRRCALAHCEGFEWLRMEVADDVGLGLALKRSGAKSTFAVGPDLLQVEWYPTLGAMARGLEKNSFPVIAQYSYIRMVAMLAVGWLVGLAPFTAIGYSCRVPWLWGAATMAFGAVVVFAVALKRRLGVSYLGSLLIPVGHLIMSFRIIRSMWMFFRRGGIEWRDTFYPMDELKKGQRVRL